MSYHVIDAIVRKDIMPGHIEIHVILEDPSQASDKRQRHISFGLSPKSDYPELVSTFLSLSRHCAALIAKEKTGAGA